VFAAVGDMKQSAGMKALAATVVGMMGGLDVIIISAGNGTSEYLVRSRYQRILYVCCVCVCVCWSWCALASAPYGLGCGGLHVKVAHVGSLHRLGQGTDPDDPDSYRMLHEMHVLSPLFLTEAAIPELRKGGAGAVVSPAPATRVLSVAATGAHQMTGCCIQKLCTNSGHGPYTRGNDPRARPHDQVSAGFTPHP
jgi:NAD(P)-dependent dehydrogenase (short-subunit alcohol dehydrogenase family)